MTLGARAERVGWKLGLGEPPDDSEAVVASNVFHRAVAFGPFRSTLPDEVAADMGLLGKVRLPIAP